MSDEFTSGREPVQIVEIRQPVCKNTYGVAPCTASGAVGSECYNTNGTCQDLANFYVRPEDQLVGGKEWVWGQIFSCAELSTADSIFVEVDLVFNEAPDGIIFLFGNGGVGFYAGVNGANLVFGHGYGGQSIYTDPNEMAILSVPVAPYVGRAVTFYIEIDWNTGGKMTVWEWDFDNEVPVEVGNVSPVNWPPAFGEWAPAASLARIAYYYSVNQTTVPVSLNTNVYNGYIRRVRTWNNQIRPSEFLTAFNPLRLFFSKGNYADQDVSDAPNVIPSLKSVSTIPTKINLSTSSPDSVGLGTRATLTAAFQDHPYSDRQTDPYRATRGFDPYEKSSFWAKWFRRNPHHYDVPIRIHEGYAGQTLSQMRMREYFITGSTPPDEQGNVSLEAKDVLYRLNARNAQWPPASPGKFVTAQGTGGYMEVENATLQDYPAPSFYRVNDEIIYATWSEMVTATKVRLNAIIRASLGTAQGTHSVDDAVQRVVSYDGVGPVFPWADMYAQGAGVPLRYVDYSGARDEYSRFLTAYTINSVHVVESENVTKLVSDLSLQIGFYNWWDEEQQVIRFKAIRGFDGTFPTLSEETDFVAGSFSMQNYPRNRISQVWLHFNPASYVKSFGEDSNFKNVLVQADLPSESRAQYGSKSVLPILSIWLTSFAQALSTASKIVSRYSGVPRRISFALDAKNRSLKTGDSFVLDHTLGVDDYGDREPTIWTIISSDEPIPGHLRTYEAEDTTLYGRIYLILPSNEPDYDPIASPFTGAFIGDNSGLLSDGSDCARIT